MNGKPTSRPAGTSDSKLAVSQFLLVLIKPTELVTTPVKNRVPPVPLISDL